jgi:triphosphatase
MRNLRTETSMPRKSRGRVSEKHTGATDNLEVELKLELPVSALRQFRKLRLIRGLVASAKRSAQVSVYFDTDKRKLRRHGLTLRVRRIGDRYIQTIKATHNANILKRNEWESEIAGAAPDLARARGTALERLLTEKFRRKLKPQFETRVRRTVFPLERGGAVIELALDVGAIETAAASMRLCELELELRRGDTAELFEVARLIARALPAQLGFTSKSERGYLLCDGMQGAPVRFAVVALTPGMAAREAFCEIGRACLRHIAGNEPAVVKDDVEGVQQMRGGLGRLRAAMSLFAAILPDAQAEMIEAELLWLDGELGPARELDLMIARTIGPARPGKPGWGAMPKLSRQFSGRRVAVLARARDAIASQRYRLLKIDLAAWLEIGPWTTLRDGLMRDHGALPIEVFAAEQLALRRRKIRRRAKSFAALGARRRHELPIQADELHEAADFFGSLFPGERADKRRQKFLATLETVQDCLRRLDDIAPPETMMAAPARRRAAGRRKAFTSGLPNVREDARAAALLADTEKALDCFAKAKAYWR